MANKTERKRRLFVVTTAPAVGKGGISTAVAGYLGSETFRKLEYTLLVSHREQGKLAALLSTFWHVLLDVKKDDVVWLHCGPRLSLIRKFVIGVLAKLKGAQVAFHFHSQVMDGYLQRWPTRLFIRCISRIATYLIVLTPWWKKLFEVKIPECSAKLFVSPNPLDPEMQKLAENTVKPEALNHDNIQILAMARLTENKGFEQVIEAMPLLPQHYILNIAGEGPLMTELKDLVEEHGLSNRVKFLGWVDKESKIEVLKQSDLFCLPSRNDSFGMGFIEAMAAGLPVVAVGHQAIPDVVPHGVAGILVENSEPQLLANSIQKVLENQSKMGQAGREHVLKNYATEQVAKNLLQQLSII